MTEPADDKQISEIVRRVIAAMREDGGAPAPRPAGHVKAAALIRTIGLVVDRPDAKVDAALASAARAGVVFRCYGDDDCPIVNTRAMCGAVRDGQVAGGVIIDRYAAAAMVLAGKCPGVRAAQGVSIQAVQASLRQFDANVLVLGHATLSVYEIKSMIDRFAAGRRMGRDKTLLLNVLDEMEGAS